MGTMHWRSRMATGWVVVQLLWVIYASLHILRWGIIPEISVPRVLVLATMLSLLSERRPRERFWAQLVDAAGGIMYMVSHLMLLSGPRGGYPGWRETLLQNAARATANILALPMNICFLALFVILIRAWFKTRSEAAALAKPYPIGKVWLAWLGCQLVAVGIFWFGVPWETGTLGDAIFVVIALYGRGALLVPTLLGAVIAQAKRSRFAFVILASDAAAALLFAFATFVVAGSQGSGGETFRHMLWLTAFVCLVPWIVGIGRLAMKGVVGASAVVRGATLKRTLHARGYQWLTGQQSRELWKLCGERAFSLPHWDEVGTLPGVHEGDVASLADAMKMRTAAMQH